MNERTNERTNKQTKQSKTNKQEKTTRKNKTKQNKTKQNKKRIKLKILRINSNSKKIILKKSITGISPLDTCPSKSLVDASCSDNEDPPIINWRVASDKSPFEIVLNNSSRSLKLIFRVG